MAKYRKKPLVVEAFQITKDRIWGGGEPWPDWLTKAWKKEPWSEGAFWDDSDNPDGEGLFVGTPSGAVRLLWDSWVIKGVSNEIYPCLPEVFAATYEPVEEE